MKYDWSKEKIESAIKDSDSLSETLTKMGIPTLGNNTKTLRNKIELYNLDISHFTFGNKNKTFNSYTPASKYFNTDKSIQTFKLKEKLIKEGYKENKCEHCGISEWNGKPLVIQLHHIDGNSDNNSLENLMMLCPNCHSQTDNFCGNSNKVSTKFCPDCGKEIEQTSSYCFDCSIKHRALNKIKLNLTKEELVNAFIKVDYNMSKLGEMFNITDNGIRRWFKKFGLPTKVNEIKEVIASGEWVNSTETCRNNSGTFESKYNRLEILNLLIEGKLTQLQIAEQIGCSLELVKLCNKENPNKGKKYIINRCDLQGSILESYSSRNKAAEWIKRNNLSEITEKSIARKLGECVNMFPLFGYKWTN